MIEFDGSMLGLFREELETQSEILVLGLIQLEREPESSIQVPAMMRAAHSIKGAARIVGLEAAVRLAHALEDRLETASRGSEGTAAAWLPTRMRATRTSTRPCSAVI